MKHDKKKHGKMGLDKVKLADIYEAVAVDRGLSWQDKEEGEPNRFYKTKGQQIYDSSMVYDLGNGKYIDLASIKGAIDFLILSTCAKYNIENDRLLDFGEGVKYTPGKKYVKCVKDSVPNIEWLKEIDFYFSKAKLVRTLREIADTKRVLDEAPYEPYFE